MASVVLTSEDQCVGAGASEFPLESRVWGPPPSCTASLAPPSPLLPPLRSSRRKRPVDNISHFPWRLAGSALGHAVCAGAYADQKRGCPPAPTATPSCQRSSVGAGTLVRGSPFSCVLWVARHTGEEGLHLECSKCSHISETEVCAQSGVVLLRLASAACVSLGCHNRCHGAWGLRAAEVHSSPLSRLGIRDQGAGADGSWGSSSGPSRCVLTR